jgi:hypothetical protein
MHQPFIASNDVDLPALRDSEVIARTRAWLEQAVIGLNLCPFAKAVYNKRQIRYCVAAARSTDSLFRLLCDELQLIAAADPAEIETTLIIHPDVLQDFFDFNDFLDIADTAIQTFGLNGVIQIASFHPKYQFDNTLPDDIENCTNRSPYPTLHLIREAGIERAVASVDDADLIVERNLETMRRLGHAGWATLPFVAINN